MKHHCIYKLQIFLEIWCIIFIKQKFFEVKNNKNCFFPYLTDDIYLFLVDAFQIFAYPQITVFCENSHLFF